MQKQFDDGLEWKTFTLTYVEYPAGDYIGKTLAVLSLSPLVIVVTFLSVFAVKRDMHTMTYGIGTILNGILNYCLKHTVKEARPIHDTDRVTTKLWEQYGWPSSHAQFMWFVASYLVLFLTFRLRHTSKLARLAAGSSGVTLAAVVSYGRVYLTYHTWNQVYWGAAIGIGCSIAWFLLTQFVLTPMFPWLVSTRLFEFFLIRDYTEIPNVVWFDYMNARGEAKSRTRKKSFKSKIH